MSTKYNTVPIRMASTDAEENVLLKTVGNSGLITLNRPKALNSLNTSMVRKVYTTLIEWENSKNLIIIEGIGKAFCAGGDVKSLTLAISEPNGQGAILGQEFFREEYTLNHYIGKYKKPYIALIDGITMGGGVGLSVHGKYRVATENTLFAMPETGIGLFPDVGGTYFLPRLENHLGYFLGLTGHRLKGIDVLLAGVATHYVPAEKIPELKDALFKSNGNDVDIILKAFQPKLDQEFSLKSYLPLIEKCFSAPSVEAIIQRLNEDNSEWSKKVVNSLTKMSPTSLKISKKAFDIGGKLDLGECLKMEYRLGCAALQKDSDFVEGVRALLVDKDQNPKWNPKSLEEVTEEHINQQFAPLPQKRELLISKL
ncbi:3-hydroxyisobutyryl-CoA hydrolase, mitochondrial isoform X2 [Prorops nasuta]